MRIERKVNNNAAIGVDNNHRELIVFGKGIGFPKMPYELTDMSKIERTYYGVSNYFLELINDIPEEIFNLSNQIVDYALRKIKVDFSPNIVFTLADHIHFVIQRYESKISINMPFSHDIQFLYENEMEVGNYAIALISKTKQINLDKHEAYSIALHFINAENQVGEQAEDGYNELIPDIISMIEHELTISIDRQSFNYSRFVTHLKYLIKRLSNKEVFSSTNKELFNKVKTDYPHIFTCTRKIADYLNQHLQADLQEEVCLYLMLHINRLYDRVDR